MSCSQPPDCSDMPMARSGASATIACVRPHRLETPARSGLLAVSWNAAKAYFADDDPLVATANLVALVVLWNQPFYPLYVYWSFGPDIAPTFYTFLSTPFF